MIWRAEQRESHCKSSSEFAKHEVSTQEFKRRVLSTHLFPQISRKSQRLLALSVRTSRDIIADLAKMGVRNDNRKLLQELLEKRREEFLHSLGLLRLLEILNSIRKTQVLLWSTEEVLGHTGGRQNAKFEGEMK